jgi:hypothetical protein
MMLKVPELFGLLKSADSLEVFYVRVNVHHNKFIYNKTN